MTAGEIAHQTARFANQQFTCGEIPRLQANLKETINATGGNIGQIQRGRTGAAEVRAFGKQFANDVDIGGCVLLRLEREAGRQNGAIQIASGAAAQAVTVELCALATSGSEEFVTHRIVNDRNFGATFNTNGD